MADIIDLIRFGRHAPLLALSVRQPYAHYIAFDGKDIENRTWWSAIRGWHLLHAGLSPYDGGAAEKRELISIGMEFGGIIAAFHIADCVKHHPSNWFNGPYGLVIDQVIPLQFTPCKGALGFFDPKIDQTKLERRLA